jgi:hypothetical protein
MPLRERLRSARDCLLKAILKHQAVPSWLASLLVNSILLLILTFISWAGIAGPHRARTIVFDSALPTEEEAVVFASDVMTNQPQPQASAIAMSRALDVKPFDEAPTEIGILSEFLTETQPRPGTGSLGQESDPLLFETAAELLNKVMMPESGDSGFSEGPSVGDRVKAAGNAGDAAQAVVGHLRTDLESGPAFVIWLLDASISLEQDRHALATALEPFYADFRAQGKERSQLLSAVVAYGQGVKQIRDTSAFHPVTLNAIRTLPFDDSGVENVMSAVAYAVKRYAPRAKGRLRIIIWTDESGDDTYLLEDVITSCHKLNTVVHVVGPSSVLGTDRGLQPYTDRATGYSFLLPVARGPDTCFQERLLLPYWFDSSANAGIFNGVMVADGLPWYGGALRERLMSGIGPYALTRLALETGGTFTILDRPGEQSQFELAAMQGYFPDYRNAREIMADVQASRFRLAVMRAVATTYKPINLAPPRMRFPTIRLDMYPFTEFQPYMPPEAFRRLFTADIGDQAARIRASANLIEESLRNFGEEDWESAYSAEPSLRWRAWYDVTHGRLLAMSVRHQEYLAACKRLMTPGSLLAETNAVDFCPGPESLLGDPEVSKRREKAMRLLNRCVESNPETPWEKLAYWELEHPMGVAANQGVIPPPRPVAFLGPPPPPPPPPPVIQLPRL